MKAKKSEKPATRISTACLATMSLSAVAVILLAYMVLIAPPQQPPATPTPIPTITPASCVGQGTPATHTTAQAKDYLARVMATYKDTMRSEVPTPDYNPCDKTWSAVVRVPETNGERRIYMRMNDTPVLLLDNTYLQVVKPSFITQDKVITNGTVLLAGKINCSTGTRARLMEFSDPYCPSCIMGDALIDPFRVKYNASVDFEYHVLPSKMLAMENNYGREDIYRIAYYTVCAQKQGMLDAFKLCAVQKYRQNSVEAPLSKEELDVCLPAGLNTTQFDACMQTAFRDVAFDKTLAETYGVSETPVLLLDCQYRVFPEFVEHGFCFVHPEAAGCP